jgi:hypothetical protein
MKKIFASLFIISLLSQNVTAQSNSIRPKALGVSFVLNDFNTAQRIRSGSLEQVLRDKQFGKFKEMSPGLALTYFKGLQKNIDFAGTLAASFVNYPIPNRELGSSDALLLEADASVNLKLFSDDYWVTPYVIAGVGASKYKDYYGAILPLGAGLKVNFFDEAAFFVTAQYRVGITQQTNNHFMYSLGIAGLLGAKK